MFVMLPVTMFMILSVTMFMIPSVTRRVDDTSLVWSCGAERGLDRAIGAGK